MAAPSARTLLLVLCGLPAAGKSHLARLLQQSAAALDSAVKVEVVSFDAFLPPSEPDAFDVSAWHRSRKAAFQAVEVLLHEEVRENRVVVVDDNMQYKSMRKKCVQLAQQATLPTSVCVVYVHVDVDEAVRRNGQRGEEERVPEASIRRLAAQMEVPEADDGLGLHVVRVDGGQWREEVPQELVLAVREAWKRPVRVPEEVDEEAVQRERERLLLDAVHSLDLRLRKAVGQVMRACEDKQVHKELGKAASAKKRELLKRFKAGGGEVDADSLVEEMLRLHV